MHNPITFRGTLNWASQQFPSNTYTLNGNGKVRRPKDREQMEPVGDGVLGSCNIPESYITFRPAEIPTSIRTLFWERDFSGVSSELTTPISGKRNVM